MDILFDLDGTLVDPKPGLIGSIQYALDKLGRVVPPAEELVWLIGPPLRISLPKLLGSTGHVEEAIAHYRERYVGGAMYDAIVYDGVTDTLAALRAAGHRLVVATSKPHCYARPIIEHFGLSGYFHTVHGPELDGTNDHKADLIAHIVRHDGVDPETALMIGDREFDVTAAACNGMRAIGATWGYGSAEELAGAAALCASPRELTEVVLGLLPPGLKDRSEGQG
ncbi:MAG: HAD hydrolase-like protein [Hyphomicrobiaceae bacterium]|nr:HAD hydrolase-like protein [Hyphomicrobiaceae bacterium]